MLGFLFAGAIALVGCSPRVPGASPNPRIDGATDLGKLSPDQPLDAVIGLALQRPQHLTRFLKEQPASHDALSPYDFGEQFAMSAGQYAGILTWLRARGLTVTQVSDGRTTVSVHGIAANFERAFATDLHRFSDSDGEFIASLSGWSLAPELSGSVSGIIGLDGALPWRSHARLVPQAGNAGTASAYAAKDIEKLYNTANITNPGQGETIVILGAGLAPSTSDVNAYMTNDTPYGQTKLQGTYTVEQVGGANRDPMSLAQEEQLENTLDIEMVAAVAPYATVYHVLAATNEPGLFADGVAYIVNKHADAHSVSVSYGTCERGAAGIMPVMNAMFAQAKAEGQTWFFAAGDSGSDGCRSGADNKIVSAGYPASSPDVIGVGGTQLDQNSGAEVAWDDWTAMIPGAGGGGVSESLDKPDYQKGATPSDNARDEPDVAALAGAPFIGVYVMGLPFANPIAGTSAAAPIWASSWALVEQGLKDVTITNIHEVMYGTLGPKNATLKAFNDITTGTNGGPNDQNAGGYPAGSGYDLATGWGSPNVANLIANWPTH
jgi:kumamolisin